MLTAELTLVQPIVSLFDDVTLDSWYKISLRVTLTLSCLIVLLDDYKITPNGWLLGISAIFILGVVYAILRDPPTTDSGLPQPDKDLKISALVMLLPIFPCLFFLEFDFEVVLTWEQMPMLCVNLITTAIAITLLPAMLKQTKNNLSQSIVFLALPAFAALFSQQLALPVYLSYVQALAFLVAICCSAFTAFDSPDPTPAVEGDWLELPTHSENDSKYADSSMSDLEDSKSGSRIRWTVRWDLCSSILLAAGTGVWICFLINNFSTPFRQHTSHGLRLDTNYKASSNIDIVMSMSHEPLSDITDTFSLLKSIPSIGSKSPRLILYTKDPLADITELKHLTNATKVIQLPNVGREGHTYLHHILSSWDDLATQTFFLQASIHNRRQFHARVRDYYTSETGMLSLGFSGQTCECNNCGDRFGWQDQSGIVEKTWREVFNETCGEKRMLLTYKGQFVASAARLRANDKTLYEKLMKALEEPDSWAHQPDYLHGKPDSLNAPYFGYTLERLWSVILQCSDERIAALCPTLLSGTRRGGSKADCQCFDSS